MRRNRDKQPPKTKKYFRSTKSGAGMTKAGSKGCKLAMKGKGRAYGKNS